MRGTIVWDNLIRVQFADPAGRVFQPFRLRPVEEIVRCPGADVASLTEIAMVFTVFAAYRIPKGEVLRVKRTFGDYRFSRS